MSISYTSRGYNYHHIWQPLNVEFYDSTTNNSATLLPYITIDYGRLFLNKKAYEALVKLIEKDGEILPVHFNGEDAVILNTLKIAENLNGLNEKLSTKNEWGELQSLDFYEERITDTCVFKCQFSGMTDAFCNDTFKNTVEKNHLKGITFSEDLENIFPPDPSLQGPITR